MLLLCCKRAAHLDRLVQLDAHVLPRAKLYVANELHLNAVTRRFWSEIGTIEVK